MKPLRILLIVVIVLAGLGVAYWLKQGALPSLTPEEDAPYALDGESRAMWVWDGYAVTSAVKRAELFHLCRAWDVNRLFFTMRAFPDHQYNTNFHAAVRSFVRDAHEEELGVYALRAMPSSPKLAMQRAHYVAITYLRDFLAFNQASPPASRFDGYLEDVQPHRLPGWEENENGIQEQFVDFVREYRLAFMEFGPDVDLAWTFPDDYDRYPWITEVYSMLDYAVVHTRTDDPVTLPGRVEDELALVGTNNLRVAVGLEARDLAGLDQGKERETFHEEKWTGLNAAAERLAESFRREEAFAGVAFYEYDTLKAWEESTRAIPADSGDDAVAP